MHTEEVCMALQYSGLANRSARVGMAFLRAVGHGPGVLSLPMLVSATTTVLSRDITLRPAVEAFCS
jgi:hypothetical protein